MTADFELGHVEGFLLQDAHAALGQFEDLGFADINLQAVREQFALDALLMFAALRQLIGAAAEQQGATEGGDEGKIESAVHDASISRECGLAGRPERRQLESPAPRSRGGSCIPGCRQPGRGR